MLTSTRLGVLRITPVPAQTRLATSAKVGPTRCQRLVIAPAKSIIAGVSVDRDLDLPVIDRRYSPNGSHSGCGSSWCIGPATPSSRPTANAATATSPDPGPAPNSARSARPAARA
jgi:hypothetical protein